MKVLIKMLRPLVETKSWDYCIVWKFSHDPDPDPSRGIEWVGCCCSGSQGVRENVKEENHEIGLHVPYICKDTYLKHMIRTSACEKLAMVPSYLSLYHGIHGEVAVSKQPFWLSNDSIGTQIIVPVEGGLIELFRSKHVPEDERMIETLISRLGIVVDHGLQENDSENYPRDDKDFMTTKHKKLNESKYRSKNLVTERNRRKRINDGLYTLRALVPNISKMDKASIVGDAVEYIKDLQRNVKVLQDELKELEESDCKVKDDEVEVEVEVEVHKVGAREFLLKLMCSHKPSGFLRLMETLNSLGLEVIDINITTSNARVLNILNLKAKETDIAAKSLRDSLLTVWSTRNI